MVEQSWGEGGCCGDLPSTLLCEFDDCVANSVQTIDESGIRFPADGYNQPGEQSRPESG
jgi:hypothetical protein